MLKNWLTTVPAGCRGIRPAPDTAVRSAIHLALLLASSSSVPVGAA